MLVLERQLLGIMGITVLLASAWACGSDDSDSDDDSSIAGIEPYIGQWSLNCASGNGTQEVFMNIHSSGVTSMVTRSYPTGSCGDAASLRNVEVHHGRITSIQDSDLGGGLQTLLISNDISTQTPIADSDVTEWNAQSRCGVNNWTSGNINTYTEASPGTWASGSCWQSSISFDHAIAGTVLTHRDANGNDLAYSQTSATPLAAGLVNGQAFTALTTVASPAPGDSTELWFELREHAVQAACDFYFYPESRKAIFTLPPAVATVTMSNTDSATFAYNNNNLISTDGSLAIATIDDTSGTGSVSISFDDDHSISGAISFTRCTD